MNRKGKRVALTTAAAGALLSIVAVNAAKDRIREQWWLYELQYGDRSDLLLAARQLGEFGSMNAMAGLISALDCEGHPGAHRGRSPGGGRCELSLFIQGAVEKMYSRFKPNNDLGLSDLEVQIDFSHGEPCALNHVSLLQHINVDLTVSGEARGAAMALLKKWGWSFPLTPEEYEELEAARRRENERIFLEKVEELNRARKRD